MSMTSSSPRTIRRWRTSHMNTVRGLLLCPLLATAALVVLSLITLRGVKGQANTFSPPTITGPGVTAGDIATYDTNLIYKFYPAHPVDDGAQFVVDINCIQQYSDGSSNPLQLDQNFLVFDNYYYNQPYEQFNIYYYMVPSSSSPPYLTSISCTFTDDPDGSYTGNPNTDTANSMGASGMTITINPYPLPTASIPTTSVPVQGSTIISITVNPSATDELRLRANCQDQGGSTLPLTYSSGLSYFTIPAGVPDIQTETMNLTVPFGTTTGGAHCSFTRVDTNTGNPTPPPATIFFTIVTPAIQISFTNGINQQPSSTGHKLGFLASPALGAQAMIDVKTCKDSAGGALPFNIVDTLSGNTAITLLAGTTATSPSYVNITIPQTASLGTATCTFQRNANSVDKAAAIPSTFTWPIVKQLAPTVVFALSSNVKFNDLNCMSFAATTTIDLATPLLFTASCTGFTSHISYGMVYTSNNYVTLQNSDGTTTSQSHACVRTQIVSETISCVFSYAPSNTNQIVALPTTKSFSTAASMYVVGAQVGVDTSTPVYNNVATTFTGHLYASVNSLKVLNVTVTCVDDTGYTFASPYISTTTLSWVGFTGTAITRSFTLTPRPTSANITCTYSKAATSTDTVSLRMPASHTMTITPQPVGPTISLTNWPTTIHGGQSVTGLYFVAPTPDLAHGNLILDIVCADGGGNNMTITGSNPITLSSSDYSATFGFNVPALQSSIGTSGACYFKRHSGSPDQITAEPATIYFNVISYPAPIASVVSTSPFYSGDTVQVQVTGTVTGVDYYLNVSCASNVTGIGSNSWQIVLTSTVSTVAVFYGAGWPGATETVTCSFVRTDFGTAYGIHTNNEITDVPTPISFTIIQQPAPTITYSSLVSVNQSSCFYLTPTVTISAVRPLLLDLTCHGQTSGIIYAMTYSSNTFFTLQNSDGTSVSSSHACIQAQSLRELVTCQFSSDAQNTNNGVILPSDISFTIAGLYVSGSQIDSDITTVYNTVPTTFIVHTYATVTGGSLIINVLCVDQSSVIQTISPSSLTWTSGTTTATTKLFILTPSSTATSVTCSYAFGGSNADTANIALPDSHSVTITPQPTGPTVTAATFPSTINGGQSVTGLSFTAPSPNLAHGALMLNIVCVDGGGNSVTITGSNPITLTSSDMSPTFGFNVPALGSAIGTAGSCSFTRNAGSVDIITLVPVSITFNVTYLPAPVVSLSPSGPVYYGSSPYVQVSGTVTVSFTMDVYCTGSVSGLMVAGDQVTITSTQSTAVAPFTANWINETVTCRFGRHADVGNNGINAVPTDFTFSVVQQPAPLFTTSSIISPYASSCFTFTPMVTISSARNLLLNVACTGQTSSAAYVMSYSANTYVTLLSTDGTTPQPNRVCVKAQATIEAVTCVVTYDASNTNNGVSLPDNFVFNVAGIVVIGHQVGTDTTKVYNNVATTFAVYNYATVSGGPLILAVSCVDQTSADQTVTTSPLMWPINTAAGSANTFVLTPSNTATTVTCSYSLSVSNGDTANSRLPSINNMLITVQPTGPTVVTSGLPTTIYGGNVVSGIIFQTPTPALAHGPLILDVTCVDGDGHVAIVSGSPVTLDGTNYATASFGFTIASLSSAIGTGGGCTFARNSGSPDQITSLPASITFSVVLRPAPTVSIGTVYLGSTTPIQISGTMTIDLVMDIVCTGTVSGTMLNTTVTLPVGTPSISADFVANWVGESVTCVFTRDAQTGNNGIVTLPSNLVFNVIKQPAPSVSAPTVLQPYASGCFSLTPTVAVSSAKPLLLDLMCTGASSSTVYVMTYAASGYITLQNSQGTAVSSNAVCVAAQATIETVNCVFNTDATNTNNGVNLPSSISFNVGGIYVTGAQVGTDTTTVYNNIASTYTVHTYATTTDTLILSISCPGSTLSSSMLSWTTGQITSDTQTFALTPSNSTTTITCTYSFGSGNADGANTVLPVSNTITVTVQPTGPTVDPSTIPSTIYAGQFVSGFKFLAPTPNLAHGDLILDVTCVDGGGNGASVSGNPVTLTGSNYATSSFGFTINPEGSAIGTSGRCTFARNVASVDVITKVPIDITFTVFSYPAPVVTVPNPMYYGSANPITINGSGTTISISFQIDVTCTGNMSGVLLNGASARLLSNAPSKNVTFTASWVGETVTCHFTRASVIANNDIVALPPDFVFDVIQQPAPTVTTDSLTIAPYDSNCLYLTPTVAVSSDRSLLLDVVCTGVSSHIQYGLTFSSAGDHFLTLTSSQSSSHVCVKAQTYIETVKCVFSTDSTNTNNGVQLPTDITFAVAGIYVTGAQLGSDTTTVYNNVPTKFNMHNYATVHGGNLCVAVSCVDEAHVHQTLDIDGYCALWAIGVHPNSVNWFILTPSATATSITCSYSFDQTNNADTANTILPLSHTIIITPDQSAPTIDSRSLPAMIHPGQSVTGIIFSAPTPNLAHGDLTLDITCVDGSDNSMTVTGDNPITLSASDFSENFGFVVPALNSAIGDGYCSFARNYASSADIITSVPGNFTFTISYFPAPTVTLVPAGPIYYGSNTGIKLTDSTVTSDLTIDILCMGTVSGVMLDSSLKLTALISSPSVILPAGQATETVTCAFTRDSILGNNAIVALPANLTINILPPLPISSSSSSSSSSSTGSPSSSSSSSASSTSVTSSSSNSPSSSASSSSSSTSSLSSTLSSSSLSSSSSPSSSSTAPVSSSSSSSSAGTIVAESSSSTGGIINPGIGSSTPTVTITAIGSSSGSSSSGPASSSSTGVNGTAPNNNLESDTSAHTTAAATINGSASSFWIVIGIGCVIVIVIVSFVAYFFHHRRPRSTDSSMLMSDQSTHTTETAVLPLDSPSSGASVAQMPPAAPIHAVRIHINQDNVNLDHSPEPSTIHLTN